ncbi:MAG TPA: prepilin-type N-terminal cleavage/methylation domain-containing protein [Terriglobales bacterium]|nr:prepilin-type N-terminal cleavage/methylation domain-containing protein [Terriglobales bacterium]
MPARAETSAGFTILELLVSMAIILTVAAMAVPALMASVESARVARAVGDITALEDDIAAYEAANGSLPNTLADIGRDKLLDPWGTPYQYLNFANAMGKGQMRKDRFLVPINSDYDLYSMGEDKQTSSPLTAKVSQDDVIRGSDGSYVGLASNY